MPGEIGASRFSPRPGFGYRFHSLQVEIIAFLIRHARRKISQMKSRQPPGNRRSGRDLNALPEKGTEPNAQNSIAPVLRGRLLVKVDLIRNVGRCGHSAPPFSTLSRSFFTVDHGIASGWDARLPRLPRPLPGRKIAAL